MRKFELGTVYSLHEMRYYDNKLFVANMDAKCMSVIKIADGKITDISLGGVVLQTEVTRDGYLFSPLYTIRKK